LSWWISEKDQGQSDAFNKAFKKAKGQYYFWHNADDLLLPNSLEYAKNFINAHPNFLWFAANTIFFSKDGRIIRCARGPDWKNFLVKNASINIYGPTSIFHNTLFKSSGGFDENLHYTMDADLWMRFKNEGFCYKRINKYFWGFRIHVESKTSHAFSSNPNNIFKKELSFIIEKNKVKYTKLGVIMQSIYKIINGNYILSLADTIHMKNRSIKMLNY